MLPPKIGYETAINRLQERFGAPYRIADSFVESLLNGPVVKPNDVEGLGKCQSILGQLQFQSNLGSTDTLKQVAHRMPNYLYAKWVDVAADILANNKQPRFFDLVNFIKARARVASTLFGRDYATQAKFKVYKGNVIGDKVKGIHKQTMMATQVDTSSKIPSDERYVTTLVNKCICFNVTIISMNFYWHYRHCTLIYSVCCVKLTCCGIC